MAAEVFGEGVHDDVGAVLEGAAQEGRGHGVVDDQRHAVAVGDFGQRGDVGDVAERVADGFAIDGLGAGVDQALEGVRLAIVGKTHLDAELRQAVREQVVGAAVERGRGDDVVADAGNRLDGGGDGGHAAGHREAADAAFHRRDALFEHGVGRVGDAGVDVAGHLEVEQVGAVLGVVERVGRGLVDGHGGGVGGGFRAVAGVYGKGFDFHR